MTPEDNRRGGAPVGLISELGAVEAASVICLRLWSAGPETQARARRDFSAVLGPEAGTRAMERFDALCSLCAQHGRRPLMRHALSCRCLGSDESCFANFIATATEGDREDAMLIATLLVRADVAPMLVSLAAQFGLALKRMYLSAPSAQVAAAPSPPTIH